MCKPSEWCRTEASYRSFYILPERIAHRKKSRELLQMANIGPMKDIQSLLNEAISEFMENGLEAELDDELGYSKHARKNKDTDNS